MVGVSPRNHQPDASLGRLIRAVLLDRLFMKSASLIWILFAVSTLLFVQNTKAAATVTTFDGAWSVALNAHEYKNPDGTVTLAWVRHFRAEVKNGVLHGEIGVRGAANWYELNGKIMANGTAILRTTGITGNNPAYTAFHTHPNVSYQYQVIAHFDDQHGTGKSVNDPPGRPRDRIFTFVKDTVNDVYRRVADLLLSQGRLTESEQVLRLLKQKEYHDFLPGDVKDSASS